MEATPPFRSYNTTYQGRGASEEEAEQGEAGNVAIDSVCLNLL